MFSYSPSPGPGRHRGPGWHGHGPTKTSFHHHQGKTGCGRESGAENSRHCSCFHSIIISSIIPLNLRSQVLLVAARSICLLARGFQAGFGTLTPLPAC